MKLDDVCDSADAARILLSVLLTCERKFVRAHVALMAVGDPGSF